MEWIIGIGLFVFLMAQYPKFRKVVLVGGVALVAIGVLYAGKAKVQEKIQEDLVPFDQVSIEELKLRRGDYSSDDLFGEVSNNSEYDLTGIYISVKAYDCPEKSITADCRVIGEDANVKLSVNVPPRQSRAIRETSVYLGNMPAIRGNFLWTFDIIGTKGKKSLSVPISVQKEDKKCKKEFGKNSYLDLEGGCKCENGFGMTDDGCLVLDLACKNLFGFGAEGDGGTTCYCGDGYSWNATGDKCVSFDVEYPEPAETDISFISEGEEGQNYYIILATFSSRDDARNYANEERARVINTSNYDNFEDGYFAVGRGAWATYEEAKDVMDSSSSYPKDAYIKNGGTRNMEIQEIPVLSFFMELELGNGYAASKHIIPSKQGKGNYSGEKMTKFYSEMHIPLLLADIKPTSNPDVFEVMYSYEQRGLPVCFDTAMVHIKEVSGISYIEKILPEEGC